MNGNLQNNYPFGGQKESQKISFGEANSVEADPQSDRNKEGET